MTSDSDMSDEEYDSLRDSFAHLTDAVNQTRTGFGKGYSAIKRRIRNLPLSFYVIIYLVWTTAGDVLTNAILARVPILAPYITAGVTFTAKAQISNVQLLIVVVGMLFMDIGVETRRFKRLEDEVSSMSGPEPKADGGRQMPRRDDKGRFKSSDGSDGENLTILGGALVGGAAGSIWGPGGAAFGAVLGAIFGDAQTEDDER